MEEQIDSPKEKAGFDHFHDVNERGGLIMRPVT